MSLLVTVFCTGSLPAPWGEPGLWLHTGGKRAEPTALEAGHLGLGSFQHSWSLI